ncbi:MAG: hypothetical protein J0I47_07870 [Sphingomonas sp.]|nr:hypothetical protein [Sphingomonas sp.]
MGGALLAGCGQPSSGGNGTAPAATPTTDPMEAKIAALTPKQREITFYKAIYDADYQCDKVVKITDRPRDNGHQVWLVTCNDTGDYYVTLLPGGVFTVSGTPQAKTRLPSGTKVLPKGSD